MQLQRVILIFCLLFPLGAEAKRIVSLSPAISAVLQELDADKDVVAVTTQDFVLKRQRVGSFIRFSLEAVIALAPDLIIYQNFQETQIAPLMRLNRFQMLKVDFTDIGSIDETGRKITEFLALPPAKVKKYWQSWLDFQRQYRRPQALKFLALVEYSGDFEQIFAMGQASYLSEMLVALGYKNCLISNKDYLKISQEIFYRKQKPDIILNFSLAPYPKKTYQGIRVINLNERSLTLPSLNLSAKAGIILKKINEALKK